MTRHTLYMAALTCYQKEVYETHDGNGNGNVAKQKI